MTQADMSTPSSPLLGIRDGVATITLNRPAHRNRLEDTDLATLLQHFARVDADPSVRVLVLRANTQGQPRPVFCAGYDIGGFEQDAQASSAFERVPDALAALRPVTICALNGSLYGGATDLFLACDLRIALQGVEFRMPATALGLHFYPSGLLRYVERLGLAAAKRAFLTARPFTADQLWQTGCLEALARAETFESELERLLQDVLSLAPLAAESIKRSLNEIAAGCHDPQVLREREHASTRSDDFAEGRRAFVERRRPVFSGR
jgi:enoyl-CoA hydratase/carnithine racemase